MIGSTYRFGIRSTALPLLFVAATSAMLATRVASAGTSPVEWLRAGIGAASLGVLLAMKRGGFARAAAYAFAIECVGAIGVFVFVDAPAVEAHFPAILRAVATVAPHGLR